VVERKTVFWDSYLKWLASSYGLAALPLLSRFVTGEWQTFRLEGCVFVLVIGASGALEAYSDDRKLADANTWRTVLFGAGIVSIVYGAICYGKLAGAAAGHLTAPFTADLLLAPLLVLLSITYAVYKVPMLRKAAYGR
jgi:hypothetical protein